MPTLYTCDGVFHKGSNNCCTLLVVISTNLCLYDTRVLLHFISKHDALKYLEKITKNQVLQKKTFVLYRTDRKH